MKILAINPITINHEKFHKLGHELFLLKPYGHYSDDHLYKNITPLNEESSFEDFKAAAIKIHQEHQLDAVDLCCDQKQEWLARIGKDLGLKSYVSHHTVELMSDKYKTRDQLRRAGLDPTRSITLTSVSQIREFYSQSSTGIVVKPRAGLGSRQIFQIHSTQQLEAAVLDLETEISKGSQAFGGLGYIAEEFLEGNEYSIESFSIDGQHYPITVTQKYKNQADAVEIGHAMPANISELQRSETFTFISKVLTELGVTDGPAHSEVFLTPSGPRLVETHCRLAGDFIPALVKLAFGIDLVELMVNKTLGLPIDQSCLVNPKNNRFSAISYGYPNKEGKITQIENQFNSAEFAPETRLFLFASEGHFTTLQHGSMNRLGACISVGSSFDEALSSAKRGIQSVRFEIE